MANRITQYQAKAEVRPFQGSFQERTTPDKWLGVEYLPFGNALAKASALVVLAVTTAFAFVPVTTAPVAPAVSTWHPAIEQPVRAVRNQYLAPSYFEPERQPQPRVDSWHPAVEQPLFDKRRAQYEYPSSFAPEQQPQPRVDSWYQQASEPVRAGADKRVRWLGDSDLQLTAAQQPERVSVDKFDPGIQQPQFDKKRQQHTYEWSSYDPRPFPDKVFADRWWQQPNQPQFDVRRLQYLAPSFFGPDRQPQPRLDSWWQQASEPVRLPDRRVQWQGLSVLGVPPAEDVERTSVDKYDPGTQQPRFDIRRQQYTFEFSFFNPQPFPSPVFADKWWQQASEPVRLPDRRIQAQGASEVARTPAEDVERTNPDKWLPAIEQPLGRSLSRAYLAELSGSPLTPQAATVSVDSWYQQPSEPVRVTPSRRHLSEFAVSGNGAAERVSADKWQPLGNQPVFDQRRLQYLAPSYFGPDKPALAQIGWLSQASEPVRKPIAALQSDASFVGVPERVTVDKWYQQPNQPLFDLKRTQYLNQSSFAPERQPVPPVTSWWQLGNQPLFAVRHAEYAAPSAFAPDLQPVPVISTWWVLPNQPQFAIRRAQYLAPSAIAPEHVLESLTLDKWWQLGNQPLFDQLRLQYGYQFAGFWPHPLFPQVGRIATSLSSSAALVSSSENSTADVALAVQIADTICRQNGAEMVLSSTSASIAIALIPDN